MSSRHEDDDTDELSTKSLLERIRLLEKENKRLREITTISEKVKIMEKVVEINLPPNYAGKETNQLTETSIDMGEGIKFIMYGKVNYSTQKVTLWYVIQSPVESDATIIMRNREIEMFIAMGYVNDCRAKEGPIMVDFLSLSSNPVNGSRHIVDIQNSYVYRNALSINIKMVLSPTVDAVSSDNSTAIVQIENQKLSVDVPYVSKWSQFLQAYFTSNMKERADGIYPINDCTLSDFREMLEVIYPSSKPIDESNVEAMLDLGDRFIMPMLTRKCEVFLSKNASHGISQIRMIGMADRFNLIRTRTIVFERLCTTALLRSKIIRVVGYESLEREMKREIDARYVQLDVKERGPRHLSSGCEDDDTIDEPE